MTIHDTTYTERLTRQVDHIPLSVLDVPVTVIGAGAVGAATVLLLAKMGLRDITVIDFDRVSIENVSCSLFGLNDLHPNDPEQNEFKVDALARIVKENCGLDISTINSKYQPAQHEGIVIAALDNMAVRREAWEAQKDGWCEYFIDPRMSLEYAILCLANPQNADHIKAYEGTFYSDEEAIQERCTAKATGYTAFMLAGLVVATVKDILIRADGHDRFKNCHWAIDSMTFADLAAPVAESVKV